MRITQIFSAKRLRSLSVVVCIVVGASVYWLLRGNTLDQLAQPEESTLPSVPISSSVSDAIPPDAKPAADMGGGDTVSSVELPALSHQEVVAAVSEIRAVSGASNGRVASFVVREATPERMSSLYQTAEFLASPAKIRRAGLFFAGQGNLLAFEKPSDVLLKMEAWFPKELALSRQLGDEGNMQELYISGPYAKWSGDAVAFLYVWNCMPRGVWLHPERAPFSLREGENPYSFHGIGSVRGDRIDTKSCMQVRRSLQSGGVETDAVREELDTLAKRGRAVLSEKFARYLAAHRCNGTGPDDCVAILHFWAEISPADPELGKALRALERDVAPTSSLEHLPGKERPLQDTFLKGDERLDEALRRAAFLRAKVLSIENAASGWATSERGDLLRQMSFLWAHFNSVESKYRSSYDFWRHAAVDPWKALMSEVNNDYSLMGFVTAEMNESLNRGGCRALVPWLRMGRKVGAAYELYRLRATLADECGYVNWRWLSYYEPDPPMEALRRIDELVNEDREGRVREELLGYLTGNGEDCYPKARKHNEREMPKWVRDLCRRGISQPQLVSLRSPMGRLAMNDGHRFHEEQWVATEKSRGAPQAQEKWLVALVQRADRNVAEEMRTIARDWSTRGVIVTEARRWSHPRHGQVLVELYLDGDVERSVLHMVIAPSSLKFLELPHRFGFGSGGNRIIQVSDVDDDGNLELWLAKSFRTCENNDNDLKRELDCSLTSASMGEISGETLSFYADSKSTGSQKLHSRRAPGTPWTKSPSIGYRFENTCNLSRLAPILEERLAINLGSDSSVVAIQCAPHPANPGQLVVAIFHELNDSAADTFKGFLVATVDMKREKLLRFHRGLVDNDASVRFDSSSLSIDPTRYELAPGVFAFGVRMHIGHSPKFAEGGESDYLTLLVEEKRRLRPVLEMLPMSYWYGGERTDDCTPQDGDCSVISVARSLAVSSAPANGFRSINIIERRETYVWDETEQEFQRTVSRATLAVTLHARSGTYKRPKRQY